MSYAIGIPKAEYNSILSDGRCTHTAEKIIKRFLNRSDFQRILLYGGSMTGIAVRACLGGRFVNFVDTSSLSGIEADAGDCVIITTSPVHVPEVEKSLKNSRISVSGVLTPLSKGQIQKFFLFSHCRGATPENHHLSLPQADAETGT